MRGILMLMVVHILTTVLNRIIYVAYTRNKPVSWSPVAGRFTRQYVESLPSFTSCKICGWPRVSWDRRQADRV